tara:strand:+ start:190 stop:510 length:321 start_codon:yes stop_codon:yes gene_type:complete
MDLWNELIHVHENPFFTDNDRIETHLLVVRKILLSQFKMEADDADRIIIHAAIRRYYINEMEGFGINQCRAQMMYEKLREIPGSDPYAQTCNEIAERCGLKLIKCY